MASTTDPGAVPLGASPLQSNLDAGEDESVIIERDDLRGGLRRRRGIRRCRKCNDNYKPGRAHHDSVTGRCIIKMDHFCPWVGNAVGIMNHKVSEARRAATRFESRGQIETRSIAEGILAFHICSLALALEHLGIFNFPPPHRNVCHHFFNVSVTLPAHHVMGFSLSSCSSSSSSSCTRS